VKLLLYRASMSTLSRQRNKNNSVVVMTSNRTVVASLVCLVVFCQRYWNTIGDVLQSTWLKIINVCGDDDESLYFYGKLILNYIDPFIVWLLTEKRQKIINRSGDRNKCILLDGCFCFPAF